MHGGDLCILGCFLIEKLRDASRTAEAASLAAANGTEPAVRLQRAAYMPSTALQ